MTYLEKLIDQAATRGCVQQLHIAIEEAGAAFAKEMLADPAFRQTVRDLIQETTRHLMERMNTRAPTPKPKKQRKP